MSDRTWRACPLRHDLGRGSFIPGEESPQWRDWCRDGKRFVDTAGEYKRRVRKLLKMAGIKTSSPLVS